MSLSKDLERLTKPLDISPTDERASERKERLMDICSPLVPGCAICEIGVAIPRCAQRANAIGRAFHPTPRRIARYVLRYLVGAAKRDVLVTRTLDRRAAYLVVYAHDRKAL